MNAASHAYRRHDDTSRASASAPHTASRTWTRVTTSVAGAASARAACAGRGSSPSGVRRMFTTRAFLATAAFPAWPTAPPKTRTAAASAASAFVAATATFAPAAPAFEPAAEPAPSLPRPRRPATPAPAPAPAARRESLDVGRPASELTCMPEPPLTASGTGAFTATRFADEAEADEPLRAGAALTTGAGFGFGGAGVAGAGEAFVFDTGAGAAFVLRLAGAAFVFFFGAAASCAARISAISVPSRRAEMAAAGPGAATTTAAATAAARSV